MIDQKSVVVEAPAREGRIIGAKYYALLIIGTVMLALRF